MQLHKFQITKTCIGLLGYLFIGSIFAHIAHAQSVQTLTIVPPTNQFTVTKGSHVDSDVKLVSDSSNPIQFNVTVVDFIVDNDNGIPHLNPNIQGQTSFKRFSAASWIHPDTTSFTLEPRSRFTLPYSIDVPADAPSGGHYAAIVFTPVSLAKGSTASTPSNSQTSIKTQIGALIYITVPGSIHTEAHIINFKVPSFLEFGPIPVSFEIQNLSDVHIRPTGTIEARGWFSNTHQSISEYNIFPGVSRSYQAMAGSHFMFGPYTVTTSIRYANGKHLVASTTVWVIPWKYLIILFLALISLALTIFHTREKKIQDQILKEFEKWRSA